MSTAKVATRHPKKNAIHDTTYTEADHKAQIKRMNEEKKQYSSSYSKTLEDLAKSDNGLPVAYEGMPEADWELIKEHFKEKLT